MHRRANTAAAPGPFSTSDPLAIERIIANSRPGIDDRTCGQAAVATILAHYRLGPFVEAAADDGEAIDHVRRRHPPDLPFGLGSSAFRIAVALRSYGLGVEVLHSGPLGLAPAEVLARARAHTDLGHPLPVCVDDGLLGGAKGAAHWAILTACEDGEVRLGNARRTRLPMAEFLRAWRCRLLPWPHHHCGIICWP